MNESVAPVAVAEGPVFVLHKTLVLAGDNCEDIDLPGDNAIRTGRNVVMADSAWGTHDVRVRLELWSSEPEILPLGDGETPWEITDDATLPLDDAGDLIACTLTSGPADDEEAVALRIPAAGVYRVRMYCRGRAEALRVQLAIQEEYAETLTEEQFVELDARGQGVEQYLFQIWPLAAWLDENRSVGSSSTPTRGEP